MSVSQETELKSLIAASGVFVNGHFIFANGDHATVKLEMDNLWDSEIALGRVLQVLANETLLLRPNVIMGVPTGGQRLANALTDRGLVQVPVAQLERVPGGDKRDFRFCTEADRFMALAAQVIVIEEDVVTSLSSIAGVVALLNPRSQDIHSLAIWRRSIVLEKYKQGITDHYLIEQDLPSFPPALCPVCQ